MPSEIESIISLLESNFEKKAWYGPSIKEALKDITIDHVNLRGVNTHSIIELVAHMTAWRIFVIEKLKGNVEYKVADELNFPVPSSWDIALKALEESQHKLIAAIKEFDSSLLHLPVPKSWYDYTFFTLLHGIIHHDTYHIGQIVLIKKSM